MQPFPIQIPPSKDPAGDLQHDADTAAARWQQWAAALLAALCEA